MKGGGMLHEMTATHLRNAFGGESMAHMRYLLWADRAQKDDYPNVTRLLRAITHAERIYASNRFRVHRGGEGVFGANPGVIFGLGTTGKNLHDGEDRAVVKKNPVPSELEKSCNEAIEGCPEDAIQGS